MYKNIIKCIRDLNSVFILDELDFVKHVFIFGSVAKGCVNSESDIDLLVIGTKDKSIDLVSHINKILDSHNSTDIEIDLKYYEVGIFRNLRESNLFLKSIEKDCIRLEDAENELLRFCN